MRTRGQTKHALANPTIKQENLLFVKTFWGGGGQNLMVRTKSMMITKKTEKKIVLGAHATEQRNKFTA